MNVETSSILMPIQNIVLPA